MDKLRTRQMLGRYLWEKEKENGNQAVMAGIHDIVEMNYSMENKPWWVKEQVSSDGYDSLKDAVDLMGTKYPKLAITPYAEGKANKEQAEAIEQVLMWQLQKINNRRGDALKQATKMAYQYSRVAAQLIYLPWEIQRLEGMKKSTKRVEAALKKGDFMLKIHDTRDVYPYWTDYGMEGVLVRSILPAREVDDFWQHKSLKKKLDEDEDLKWVTQYDLWTTDQRTVWCVPHERGRAVRPDEEGFEVLNDDSDTPFIPWVVSDFGEHLRPMLYAAWKSRQWELLNTYLSASSSEVSAYIAAPRQKIEGPSPESVRVNYGEPGRAAEVPPGHNFEILPPPGLDPALEQKILQLQGMVSKSTIPHGVQTGDFGSGAAFAAIREIIDLSSRRLNDGKTVLENFYSEVFEKMLRWIDYSETSITAYVESEYTGAKQVRLLSPAQAEELPPEAGYTFDPENIELKVTMSADIPEDQVARQNAAQMFVQMGGSKEKALDMVGIENPAAELKRAREEQLEDAKHGASLMKIQMMAELEMQQLAQQMAQQQQQQAQGQQQQRNVGVGNQNLRGRGFDPAQGGTPPELGNPGTSSSPVQGGRNAA